MAFTAACASTGLDLGLKVTTSLARGLGEAVAPAGARAGATAAARELVGGTPARRRWQGGNRCWIEVRGLDGPDAAAVGDAVLASVRARDGVHSARINRSVRRVIVSIADDGPSMDELCRTVAEAETRCGGAPDGHRPADLPGDGVLLAGRLIAAGANGVGLGVATAGLLVPWRGLPPGLAAAVTVVDYQPRLRAVVEHRLGKPAADSLFGLASASVYTLTQAPASLAVEVLRHLGQVAETASGSAAWQRREPDLAARAEELDGGPRPQRPCPLPPGPIERHAQRSGVAQAVAAPAVGLMTGDVAAGATAAVVTAPKAARNAREAFAATLGRGLADAHDVVALRPDVVRLLDRIDAVVIDPRVLLTDELQVGQLDGVPEHRRTEVWRWAHEQLRQGTLSAGWHRAPVAHEGNGHGATGQVLIRHVHHPLAAAVVGEVRRADIEVVTVDGDELDELRSSFDDFYPAGDSVDAALQQAVVTLQSDGRTVALLSSSAAGALAAADLAIGLLEGSEALPWAAGLLAPDLEAAWRVLHALPAAARASRRGIELATSATALGGLLMVPGVRGQGPGPVTAGAAAGLISGLMTARGVLADPLPTPTPTQQWHAMSADEVRHELPQPQDQPVQSRSVLAATASASAGFLDDTAGAALRLVGEIAAAVRDELSDPLTPVLAVGSAASAMLGSPVDAILVGSVLTGNAMLAASQQVRAERLLRRLLAVQDPLARRIQPGGPERYDSVEAGRLRPGDLVEVRSGEVIPADCRIVESTDLEVDESALTGESLPVPKRVDATPGAVVAERACMLYATTTVVSGTAVGVVTTVGAQTQVRRAAEVAPAQSAAVGLQTQLRELTNRALPFSLAGGALVSGLGLLRAAPLRAAIADGVAVAVAAVPEGLPLVATLAQQASARRLSGAGALVRSPKAVEALGRIDVVCFDKTGTLSENRLRATQVRGVGGATEEQVLAAAAQATEPSNGGKHQHATDAAVVEAAEKRGVDPASADAHLSFRSGRPFAASLVGGDLFVKGAPEVLLAACQHPDAAIESTIHEMAESGLRVIAVARRSLTAGQRSAARSDDDAFAQLCAGGLEMVGLLGLSDTPREESAGVLAALGAQGIGVRLITGDHPVTASAIAAELGLPVGIENVISGSEWAKLPRRGQEKAVREKVVFARMTPEHKVQVVQTLERTGLVCAMVGDGANDAAAIRSATVGIGVASKGSDPARTAAEVMLLDGRIGALLDALDEGRQLWRRVQSAVAVLLGGNAGEVVFSIVGSALTGSSPLNTRQLLLVNMMTDALPAAALAVSPTVVTGEDGGRGPDQAALWRTVAIRGTTTAAAATSAWLMAGFTLRPRRASTVALVALVTTQLGQTLIDSHSPLVVATALGSLGALGAVISTPGVSQLLGCTPLGPLGWGQALGTAGVATVAATVAPRLVSRFQSSMSTTPTRQSAAYNSRNGIAMKWDMTDTGSEVARTPDVDTSSTVRMAGVEMSNTP
ncbi:MAG: cation-translocating P-type ATPase [Actinomycetota bacterium]|nr:cation-translocating P-type ATPase [Actinomycetota bacterium]